MTRRLRSALHKFCNKRIKKKKKVNNQDLQLVASPPSHKLDDAELGRKLKFSVINFLICSSNSVYFVVFFHSSLS